MMSDLDILHQMIQDTAKVDIQESYGKYMLTLDEPSVHDCSVNIYGVPKDTLAIRVDAFKAPDSIFKGEKGECKRADYMIVSCKNNKNVVLFLEMKKNKGSNPEIVQQLSGALCFFRYCREIAKMFWTQKNFLKDISHRFISIGHISIAKKPTRITRQSDIHDQPNKMLKIAWPGRLEFNHLVGKIKS